LAKPRPPRGFRDITPDLMKVRKEVFARLERVFERYGYAPIETPTIEYWETLAGKYGEEAENKLIWRFVDPWSGREYALRYDLTVPLARFIANHQDIPLPFRRYQIAPVWRHEEPQHGRYREFYQCDADIVGSPYPEADAEILNIVIDSFKELGFSGRFVVRLNDRRLLRGVFEEELGLSNVAPVYRAIDKLDKVGVDGVRRELLERVGLSEDVTSKILDIIALRGDPSEVLSLVEGRYGSNKSVTSAVRHLEEVLDLVFDAKYVKLDMSLVRGLDYYTGPILEVVLEGVRLGSVAGGGRYDDLIGLFVGRDIPATGVSIGVERVIDAGIELGIYTPGRPTTAEVQVIVLDMNYYKYAWRVAHKLRSLGFKTIIDVNRSREQAQRRKARRLDVPVLVFVGPREAGEGTVTIYSTRTSERFEGVKLEEAASIIERIL